MAILTCPHARWLAALSRAGKLSLLSTLRGPMAKQSSNDMYKAKFRADSDEALDREIEAALSGLSEEELYADKPQAEQRETAAGGRQTRRGGVVEIGKCSNFGGVGGERPGE